MNRILYCGELRFHSDFRSEFIVIPGLTAVSEITELGDVSTALNEYFEGAVCVCHRAESFWAFMQAYDVGN